MLKLGKKSPKQERSKGTVEAIYGAVARILDKEGPLGLTTNKIAEVAGISVGSLYQYFKNKESIFEAILLRMTENNVRSFEDHLAKMPDGMPVRDLIRVVVQTQYENIEGLGAVSTTMLHYAPQMLSPSHFKKMDERILAFLMKAIETKKVVVRPARREEAYFLCSQAVRSVIFMSFVNKSKEERPAIIEELIDMLTLYLEPRS